MFSSKRAKAESFGLAQLSLHTPSFMIEGLDM
jgi:hypothetical protein